MERLMLVREQLAKVEERRGGVHWNREAEEVLQEAYNERRRAARSVEGFWLTALMRDGTIAGHVSSSDVDVLRYLDGVELSKNSSGFTISLDFKENPFFENSVITKEVAISGSEDSIRVSPAVIRWRNEKKSQLSVSTLPGPYEDGYSFFRWCEGHNDTMGLAIHFRDIFYSRAIDFFLNEGSDVSEEDDDEDEDEDEDEIDEVEIPLADDDSDEAFYG